MPGSSEELAILVRAKDFATKRLTRIRRSVTGLATSVTGLAGAFGAAFAIRGAIRTMADFEETMARLRGVAIKTNQTIAEQTAQFEALEAKARELGATTRFTASEAADGLLFLSRAGFSVDESLRAIGATLDLAAAESLELGEAADIASNILSQFSLDTKETTRIVDALVVTAGNANTDVRQLAEAMKLAGPVAGALGIEVEETAAAIGVLGNSGIQASLAGTTLRGAMAALLDVTPAARQALGELGIAFDEVNPEKKNLVEIFRRFRDANLGAAQAVRIFGRRQAAGALVLARNADQIKELTELNKELSGEAQRRAKINEQSTKGSLRALKSSLSELAIAIGDSGFLGSLKQVIDGWTLLGRAIGGSALALLDLDDVWARVVRSLRDGLDHFAVGFKTIFEVLKRVFLKFIDFIEESFADFLETVANGLRLVTFGIETDVASSLSKFARKVRAATTEEMTSLSVAQKELNAELLRRLAENEKLLFDSLRRTQKERRRIRREAEADARADTGDSVGFVGPPDMAGRLREFVGGIQQARQAVAETGRAAAESFRPFLTAIDAAGRGYDSLVDAVKRYQETQAKAAEALRRVRTVAGGLREALEQLPGVGELVTNAFQSVAFSISSGLGTALTDIVEGTKSAGDAFKEFARSVVKRLGDLAIEFLIFRTIAGIANVGDGQGFFSGQFQTGGRVARTGIGLVHRGEEIIPASRTRELGGGNTIEQNIHFHMAPDAESNRAAILKNRRDILAIVTQANQESLRFREGLRR